jgi:hypothetical protein
MSQRLQDILAENGYRHVLEIGDVVCAVTKFAFTSGVCVDLDEEGYDRRYCFEHERDAIFALASWDGTGHISGPWIKCKGRNIDLLNPALGASA